jgi:hypothetical protein
MTVGKTVNPITEIHEKHVASTPPVSFVGWDAADVRSTTSSTAIAVR